MSRPLTPSSQTSAPVPVWNESFELLRILSILLLIGYHVTLMNWDTEAGKIANGLQTLVRAGWIGSDIFLALTGFLSVVSLGGDGRGAGVFFAYISRRFLRIAPLYYVFLALYLHTGSFFIHLVSGGKDWRLAEGFEIGLWTFTSNIIMAGGLLSRVGLEGLFALSLGAQLLLPVSLLLCFRKNETLLLPLLIGFLLLANVVRITADSANYWAVYLNTWTRLDAFVLGVILALLLRRPLVGDFLRRYARLVFVGALFLLIFTAGLTRGLSFHDSRTTYLVYPIVGLFAAALILLASQKPALPRALKPLSRAGKVVFAVYLVKLPTLYFVHHALQAKGVANGSTGMLLLLFCGILLCSALGFLLWFLVERPLALGLARLRKSLGRD